MTTAFWAAATTAWFVLMTWLSHQSGPQTSRNSRRLAEELHTLLPSADAGSLDAVLRKAAHVAVFAVLTVLLGTTLAAGRKNDLRPLAAGALLVWCWGDEATKRMVPGRHFSWLDVCLNMAGVLLGGAGVLLTLP